MVTVGGTIPNQDIPELKELGVAEVFTPGAPTQKIIDFIEGAVARALELYRPDGTVEAHDRSPSRPCHRLRSRRHACSQALRRLHQPLPSAIVVVGYGVSFWLLALVLKHLSVGTTYAIWSAVGTAAIALVGIAAYGEGASPLKLASLGLIIVGVIGLNAAGAH